MKKLLENKNFKYIISESIAFILGLLTFVFLFLPAVFEEGQPDSSIFNLTIGSDRLPMSPILVIGFISILLGFLITLTLLIMLLINKSNSKLMTILSITSIVLTIVGCIISSSAIFISGFTELNSALGFNQGIWGIKIGTFLVPIFGLLSVIASYPAALVILHEKDLKDKIETK